MLLLLCSYLHTEELEELRAEQNAERERKEDDPVDESILKPRGPTKRAVTHSSQSNTNAVSETGSLPVVDGNGNGQAGADNDKTDPYQQDLRTTQDETSTKCVRVKLGYYYLTDAYHVDFGAHALDVNEVAREKECERQCEADADPIVAVELQKDTAESEDMRVQCSKQER